MTKALLHELGQSLSYGRLSLRAKVLWPMLLASSDDQGRGLAEADAIKWHVCPNVPEIDVDDVPELLQEMVTQSMILLYDCDRECSVYQVVRWWEYQDLQWARPSKYSPPEDWKDRIRYSNRGDYHVENWPTKDGEPGRKQGRKPPRTPGRKPPDEQGRLPTEPNLTELNSTQLNSTDHNNGADAPEPSSSAIQTCRNLYGDHFSAEELEQLGETADEAGSNKALPALEWCKHKDIYDMFTIVGTIKRWIPHDLPPPRAVVATERAATPAANLPDPVPRAPPSELEQAWATAVGELVLALGRQPVDLWLRNSTLLERENGRAKVQLADSACVEWVSSRWASQLAIALETAEVECIAAPDEPAPAWAQPGAI